MKFDELKKALEILKTIAKQTEKWTDIEFFEVADKFDLSETRLEIEINNWKVEEEKKQLKKLWDYCIYKRKILMIKDNNLSKETRDALTREMKIVDMDGSKPTIEYIQYSKEQIEYEVKVAELEIELEIARKKIKDYENNKSK